MKQILLFLLLAGSTPSFAQFQIGNAQVPGMGRAGALRNDDLETFKKSTTIFLVRPKDKELIPEFEKSIADVWKITPFKVVTADESRQYRGKKYSLFSIGGFTVEHSNSSGMTTSSNTHLSYDLTIPNYNKHGEPDGRTILARFVLSPDIKTVNLVSSQGYTFGRKSHGERESKEFSQLYQGEYSNWGPGQIRGYLKAINDHLATAERRGIFDEIVEKDKIKALAKDTLYLPNYLKDKFNPFNGNETSKDDDEADDDAANAYPFPYRYVNTEELEHMIVNATKPIYFMIYVRSSTNKYVSVVEGHSGDIIYSAFHNISYNFKMKDLKKFAKYVD